MKHCFYISWMLLVLLAAGAKPTNTTLPGLLPGADQVQVAATTPDSQNCHPIAHLTSQQMAQPINAQQLEQAAMNQLKNAAFQKGANYIYQTRNYSNIVDNSLRSARVSGVTIKGVAYHCDTLPQQNS